MARRDKSAVKELLEAKPSNNYYDSDGKIVGTSPFYKASLVFFIISCSVVFASLSSILFSPPINPEEMQGLYLHQQWVIVDFLPMLVANIGWVFFLPLILSIVALFVKKYNNKKPALFVLSGSLAALAIWVIALLVHIGFLS